MHSIEEVGAAISRVKPDLLQRVKKEAQKDPL